MIGEPTERARRLQEKLAANAQRLRRQQTAEALAKVGGTVAAVCDRFTLHHGDPGLRPIEQWIRRNGNRYSGQRPDAVVPLDWDDVAQQVRDLACQHRFEGWCVLFLNLGYPSPLAIGLDSAQVHALPEFLFSSDDVVFASEAHRWCVNIHHEGELWLWRDIDWQAV